MFDTLLTLQSLLFWRHFQAIVEACQFAGMLSASLFPFIFQLIASDQPFKGKLKRHPCYTLLSDSLWHLSSSNQIAMIPFHSAASASSQFGCVLNCQLFIQVITVAVILCKYSRWLLPVRTKHNFIYIAKRLLSNTVAKMTMSQLQIERLGLGPAVLKKQSEKGFNDGLAVDFCWSCHDHACWQLEIKLAAENLTMQPPHWSK